MSPTSPRVGKRLSGREHAPTHVTISSRGGCVQIFLAVRASGTCVGRAFSWSLGLASNELAQE
ncbi:hypothetical protein SCLCIDRAFT_1206549 [Scleroderma citrinum Foug A]|uniref:Uncharacterized protein n=1 Tax=Scleroderma citrinum Foug A TaxID=1036808 RepID=A0A0C3A9J3_9AGAM|nr:hypothetical protein SCLCIDRAFT_1206549 [Scleroderma citrinum Foug A]